MSEKTPMHPSGEQTGSPFVGGSLLDALDAALVAAWGDDALVAALAHGEGLVEVVADLELAIETLRSALARLPPPDRPASDRDQGLRDTDGTPANRIGKENRSHG